MIVSKNNKSINYFKVMNNIISGERGDDIIHLIYSDMVRGYYGDNYNLNSNYSFYFNTSTLSFSSISDESFREIKMYYDAKQINEISDNGIVNRNGVIDMEKFKSSILESILTAQSEYLKIVNFNSNISSKINELLIRRNYSLDMLTKDEQLLVIISIVSPMQEDGYLEAFRNNVYYNNKPNLNSTVISFINNNPEMFFEALDHLNENNKKMFFKNYFNPSYYRYNEKVRTIAKEKNKEK